MLFSVSIIPSLILLHLTCSFLACHAPQTDLRQASTRSWGLDSEGGNQSASTTIVLGISSASTLPSLLIKSLRTVWLNPQNLAHPKFDIYLRLCYSRPLQPWEGSVGLRYAPFRSPSIQFAPLQAALNSNGITGFIASLICIGSSSLKTTLSFAGKDQ